VSRHLKCMVESSVDVIELGFRFLPKNTFLGPYAYTTDEFLNTLDLPKGPLYGVMLNAKDFINNDNVSKIFNVKEKSPISLVRIAVNFNDFAKVKSLANKLKNMGYIIGLNLMQANGKDEEHYMQIAKEISKWENVDVLYFADSLGNMDPKDIKLICKSLKKQWQGSLGIHTHNNKNLALINSMEALDNGVSWCDSTVTGMGRGAGNVSTESLLLEMSRLNLHRGNANLLQPTVQDFSEIKKEFNWGSNLYYHYAANNNIHPTFVQSLLDDKRYNHSQVLDTLGYLSNRDSTFYNSETVNQAIYGSKDEVSGTWDATDWLKDKEVLIVGAGPSVNKYKDGILKYINKLNPAVLFLNINQYLPFDIANATIVSHETRALFDSVQYKKINHPIILPKVRLGKLIKDKLNNIDIRDYGLTIEKDAFEIGPNSCRLEWSLAAAYALAIVTQANASKIKLVGFDGYSADDPRQEEMNNIFSKYNSLSNSLVITSLTPTTYRINQSSVFAPLLI